MSAKHAQQAAAKLLEENTALNATELSEHFINLMNMTRKNISRLNRWERLEYDKAYSFMTLFFDVRTLPKPT